MHNVQAELPSYLDRYFLVDLWTEMLQKDYIGKVPQNELEPHSGKSCYILYIIIICPDVRLSVPTFQRKKCVHNFICHFVLNSFKNFVHTFVHYTQ